jgi:nucleoside-diphosphate-sugar epimerase
LTGSGQSTTIKKLTDRSIALVGGDKEVVGAEERFRPHAGGVMELIYRHRKARELLGRKPHVPLGEGLARTIDFIRTNLHLYKSQIYDF